MRIDVVTLFPDMCSPLNQSIVGRATQEEKVTINSVNLRDFTHDARQTVDDTPYGGGAGMVLQCQPIEEALQHLKTESSKVIIMTPQGKPFTQADAQRLANENHLIFVCGHYEGLDERVCQQHATEEFSIGDYILTNGTLAAVVVIDAITRLIPGVLGCDDSAEEESFDDAHLLEYPQFTKPENWQGHQVPQLLLSGNHKKIADWRRDIRYIRTLSRRPDLFKD